MHTENLTYILVTLGLFEFIGGSEHLILLKIPSIVTLKEWCNAQFWLFFDIYSDILKTFGNDDGVKFSYFCSLEPSRDGSQPPQFRAASSNKTAQLWKAP